MADGVSMALVCLAVIVVLVWLLVPSAEHRRFSKAPGPPGLPLLGNILQVPYESSDFHAWLFDVYARYKHYPLCKLVYLRVRYALLWSAEAVEVVLSSTKETTKSDDYELAEPWLGKGLLTSTGEKWFTRRRLLTPSFHFRILSDFLQVINEQSRVLVDILADRVDGEPFDISPRLSLCTLDIICETAMGKQVHAQLDSESDYVKAVHALGGMLMKRFRRPYLWPDWLYYNIPEGKTFARCVKTVKGFAAQVIKDRYAEFREEEKAESEQTGSTERGTGRKRRLAFLDTLLHLVEDESNFSLEHVQEEVDTFMFAGHDTTSASISWAVYNIGAHPQVQQKLQQELARVFGEDERYVSEEDLKQLKYLECVIKESMRLYAPVPMIVRSLQEDLNIAGIDVPRGTRVSVMPMLLHHDERYFPEPHKFDPERFTLENSAGRHPYAYVPFSAGPRNCIGQRFAFMEMKVVLSSILRRYHVESTQKPTEVCPIPELVLRPQNGIHVKLTHRSVTM